MAYREEELMDSKNSGYETEPQLRSMVCCPYYFHFRGPSAVMTQRIVNLARRYRLILMTRSDVEVPTDILDSGAVIHRRRNGRPGFIHDLVFRLLTWYDFWLIYRKYRFQAVFGIRHVGIEVIIQNNSTILIKKGTKLSKKLKLETIPK